jgi:hypothetical protein
MKVKSWFIALLIFIIILLVCLIASNNTISNLVNKEQYNKMNNTTQVNNISVANTSQSNIDPYFIPSSEYVINHINWSSYPNLQTGYVLVAEKSGPTYAINYDFIEVQICTEIKNTDSETIILEQLSGVAREAKSIYGPASGVNIHGTKGGASFYCATILPFNDTVLT